MRKEVIVGSFLVLVFMVNFVSAENSTAGVSYDSNIVKAFQNESYVQSLISQENFIGLKIINGTKFANVIVRLKDNSGINITGTTSQKAELFNQRDERFKSVVEGFISGVDKENIIVTGNLSNGFGALISQKGFDELSNNAQIEEIIWSQYKPELTNSEEGTTSEYTSIFTLLLIILVVILIYFLNKQKRGKT